MKERKKERKQVRSGRQGGEKKFGVRSLCLPGYNDRKRICLLTKKMCYLSTKWAFFEPNPGILSNI